MGVLNLQWKNEPETKLCIITHLILQHTGSQKLNILQSKKTIIILSPSFNLAYNNITYPKALCTVHNLIQKSNSIIIFLSLGKLREILFKKYSLERLKSIVSTVMSETITNGHHSETDKEKIHQEQ